MYQSSFGNNQQIRFNNKSEYYELLGYLAKNDRSSKLVWENNDQQGAWGQEGRIEFFNNPPTTLQAFLHHTAGNSSLSSRVNCNEFVKNIVNNHNFAINSIQDVDLIKSTVPKRYLDDFERGISL